MSKNIPQNNLTIKILIVLFIILMCFLIFIKIKQDNDPNRIMEEQRTNLFSVIDKTTNVNVTKYSVYGTHFNVEGTLNTVKISGIKINYVDLIIKNLEGDEIEIASDFNYTDDSISFSTSDTINEGINLEDLSIDNYYLLLKIIYSNGDIKYYSLKNASEYENTTYYTLTKNNSNNKIDITFDTYNDIPYMSLNVTKAESLPEDVYDIAIDPGHGGIDTGGVSGDYTEADLVLEYGLNLKSKLEALGLKVFISRDGSESSQEDTTTNMYDEDGRINILSKSKAKLLISLQLNSNSYDQNDGGVEIYAPNNCNLDFANLLASNIVTQANTHYSNLSTFKKADGVYVRNFTNADISSFNKNAQKDGYEPYNITTDTPYLYIIRETGGISTNAFVDGRNKEYGTNQYYNSNTGIETYSIELGYMTVEQDFNNILTNSDKYMEAISQSIKTYYLDK